MKTILQIIFLSVLTSCTTVPITGRKQLAFIPTNQILALSQKQYAEVMQNASLSDNVKNSKMLQRVGEKIASAVDEYYQEKGMVNNFSWEYNLVNDDNAVNAWCMPGGKIVVYTGILPYTKDEGGLAAVVGHEVAHAIAKHGNERMTQSLIAQSGTTLLSKAMKDKPKETKQIFMKAFGLGAQFGVLLPFSRLQESEADRIGLILMAKAGYDPRNAIGLWERMKQGGSKKAAEFFSTHPSNDRRIADIKTHLPGALIYYHP